jgi:hypothetical protein
LRRHLSALALAHHGVLLEASRAFNANAATFRAYSRAQNGLVGRIFASRTQQARELLRALGMIERSWGRLCYARESIEETLRGLGTWDETTQEDLSWLPSPEE